MRPTRIIAVNRYYKPDHSATSQLLADLAEHLVRHGAQVTIITSGRKYDDPAVRFPARERRQGVVIHRVWTTGFGRGWLPGRALDYLSFTLSSLVGLLTWVRRGDILIAKTDPPLISVVAGAVAAIKGATLVNWCQDLFPEVASALGIGWADGPVGRVLKVLRNRSLHRAAFNVVVSDAMAEHLKGQGVAAAKIRVIHNWADDQIAPIAHHDNPLRQAWGFDRQDLVIGYSGNLGRAHLWPDIRDLIELTIDLPKLRWLFIGGGAGMAALQSDPLIVSRKDRVQFRPYQDRRDLRHSLSVPDIHLVALDRACEGLIMPSKIHGGLAAGRPILFLGDPNGGVARFVSDHQIGLVLDPGSPAEARRAIIHLVSDDKRLAELGRRARRLHETKFAAELALAEWSARLAEMGAAAPAVAGEAAPAVS